LSKERQFQEQKQKNAELEQQLDMLKREQTREIYLINKEIAILTRENDDFDEKAKAELEARRGKFLFC